MIILTLVLRVKSTLLFFDEGSAISNIKMEENEVVCVLALILNEEHLELFYSLIFMANQIVLLLLS